MRITRIGAMMVTGEVTIILFGGPLYLCCVRNPPNPLTDVLGPIEIEPTRSQLRGEADQAAANVAGDTAAPTDTPLQAVKGAGLAMSAPCC